VGRRDEEGEHTMARRRWVRWWTVLVAPVLMVVLAPAQAAASITGPTNLQVTFPGAVPTTPQNLRANHVDGVLQSFTWDPSTMENLEHSIWYEIHMRESNGAFHRMTVFHTTVTPQELADALYLDPGRTYTIRIVAWGHSAGANRPSDYSNPLTVTFPNT
jgi:hypothetical protein